MMITKLCHIIADFFIKEKIISEEQRDVYEYGLELCVSTLIGVIITVVIGLLFNRFFETLTFYIVFCFTRLFCGGFHAKCYLTCKITFVCILILVLLSDCLLSGIQDYFWIILYLFSLIVVCSFAPVENPNKLLSAQEKKRSKIISIVEMTVWLAVMGIMYILHSNLYHIVALTLFFVAALMLLGLFCGRRDKK